MLPLAFNLKGVPVIVVGAGEVGARKARELLDAGAVVTVIAEELLVPVPEGVARVERRRYRKGDLSSFWLVVSATGDPETNDEIVREASDERIWLNVVDDPNRSSFYYMALHRQGEVTVAVTTDGASPALAQEVRDRVANALPANLSAVAETLRKERAALHERDESTEGIDWRVRIRELMRNDASS